MFFNSVALKMVCSGYPARSQFFVTLFFRAELGYDSRNSLNRVIHGFILTKGRIKAINIEFYDSP